MTRYFSLFLAFDLQLMFNNIKIVLFFIYMTVSRFLLEHSKFKNTFVNKAPCNRNLCFVHFEIIVKRNRSNALDKLQNLRYVIHTKMVKLCLIQSFQLTEGENPKLPLIIIWKTVDRRISVHKQYISKQNCLYDYNSCNRHIFPTILYVY